MERAVLIVEMVLETVWLLTLALGGILTVLIFYRQAFRTRFLFSFYITFNWVLGVIVRLFREQLLNVYLFTAKEILMSGVALGIALQLALRVFQDYAGIRRVLTSMLLVVLMASLIYCFYLPGLLDEGDPLWVILNVQFQPKISSVAALMFLCIAFGIQFYNLEIQNDDKRVLLGFLIHLGPSALGFLLVERFLESAVLSSVVNIVYLGFYLIALYLWLGIYWAGHEPLDPAEYRDA